MGICSNDCYICTIYDDIDIDLKEANCDFDIISLKYYISVIKDGIHSGN